MTHLVNQHEHKLSQGCRIMCIVSTLIKLHLLIVILTNNFVSQLQRNTHTHIRLQMQHYNERRRPITKDEPPTTECIYTVNTHDIICAQATIIPCHDSIIKYTIVHCENLQSIINKCYTMYQCTQKQSYHHHCHFNNSSSIYKFRRTSRHHVNILAYQSICVFLFSLYG